MINAGPTDPAVPRRVAKPLFDTLAFPRDAYCEAFSSPSEPRDHWQPLITALDAMGSETLRERQDRVRRMRHEDGATFNPFDDAPGRGIPWALEIIPLLITAGEWAALETGLIQRALLLEQILADTYGPQNLLKSGSIPPELVLANPNFLRPCHGTQPSGNRFLTFYAVDLYRGPDGRFRVLRDYGANPTGLGYVLENRIVISRVFPELYHNTRIHRLAPFFQTFQRGLIQRASLHREEPAVVLLSPGPESRIYFEQALLSRYLGYPLVEGQDLTVRNGRVFLRKLAGLEPVEGIFRHIEDAVSDPFALRRETAGGVAGLIQVAREGNVDIVNPLGSGFVDTPALAVCLPALCRRLMGEDLSIENHPAWWCGTADGLGHVLANLERLSLYPAMERSAPAGRPAASKKAIQAEPQAFMAAEPLRPSAVPAWEQNCVGSKYTLMRVYACATEQGFAVMPGGLAITAGDVRTLTSEIPELQPSKDIWVLSDRPVVPFSLMGGLQTVPGFRRNSDLPSRVADHLLWLGRYLERAEGMVRLLRSVFRRLSGEARPADVPELSFLLDLLMSKHGIAPLAGDGGMPRYDELPAQLHDALYRQERPESVIFVLGQVREAARNVRDRLSPDAWRVINRLEGFADSPASDPLELLDDTLFTLNAFSGLAMESMTRGLGWRFMDIGRRLERAINQTGLVRTGLSEICKGSWNTLEALLEAFDSIMTYRARYRTVFQPAPVLDLLLLDESNPKALAFQISRLAAHVEHLPRQNDRRFSSPWEQVIAEMLDALRRMDPTALYCRGDNAETGSLTAFLESVEARLKELARQISADYLARVPSTPHFSMIPEGRRS